MTTFPLVSEEAVAANLSRHLALYRYKRPSYQTTMLNCLLSLWQGPHARLLDVGGGTGAVGQCIQDLFPVGSVTAVDVSDRFGPDLTIAVQTFDGERLPFADGSFDAAMLNNVVHHVPPGSRVALFREIARVVAGPVYLKDHVARSRLDHLRLAALDFIGNVPFSGMVKADYLDKREWHDLARAAGYAIAETVGGEFRSPPFSLLFPNRLELTMRWDRR